MLCKLYDKEEPVLRDSETQDFSKMYIPLWETEMLMVNDSKQLLICGYCCLFPNVPPESSVH